MQIIPLSAIPDQQLTVVLGTQQCQISVYQKNTGLFLDLAVNGVPIITGAYCQNLTELVINTYLGFQGDLVFIDQFGLSDPLYTGLGSRWVLAWLQPGEAVEY